MAVIIYDSDLKRMKEYSVVNEYKPSIIGSKEESPNIQAKYTLLDEENRYYILVVNINDVFMLYETDRYGDDQVLREVGNFYELKWEGKLDEATWL